MNHTVFSTITEQGTGYRTVPLHPLLWLSCIY